LKTQSEQVLPIQYLRGLAATMVIFHHALDQFAGFKVALPTPFGASGVDIFFVISGFVMTYTVHTHNYSPSAFLLRRYIRIVPIYWIVTIFTSALLFFDSAQVRHSIFSVTHLVASLFFWPMRDPGEPAVISPVLKLGWTLNYEMYFYLVFAALLPLGPRVRAVLTFCFFSIVCVAAALIPSEPIPLVFWGQPIVFEFLFGCIIAQLFISGRLDAISRPACVLAGLVCALGLLLSGLYLRYGIDPEGDWRVFTFGVPAAGIVAVCVALSRHETMRKDRKVLHYIGDASYSIYLMHLFAVIFIRIVWSKLALPTTGLVATAVFVVICLASGLALGCFTYAAVERPATARVKAFLIKRPARQLPSAL
jgi:peptidoglycan/LPS O-acetylase OafA/YrhL